MYFLRQELEQPNKPRPFPLNHPRDDILIAPGCCNIPQPSKVLLIISILTSFINIHLAYLYMRCDFDHKVDSWSNRFLRQRYRCYSGMTNSCHNECSKPGWPQAVLDLAEAEFDKSIPRRTVPAPYTEPETIRAASAILASVAVIQDLASGAPILAPVPATYPNPQRSVYTQLYSLGIGCALSHMQSITSVCPFSVI